LAKEGNFDQAGKELKAFGKSKSDPEAEELVGCFGVKEGAILMFIGTCGIACKGSTTIC
jgi:hypothetical protein